MYVESSQVEGADQVKFGRRLSEDHTTEPWMQHELETYFKARKRLAEMVGADPNTFSESDIAVSCWVLFLTLCCTVMLAAGCS